jgi:hypothetical protein
VATEDVYDDEAHEEDKDADANGGVLLLGKLKLKYDAVIATAAVFA